MLSGAELAVALEDARQQLAAGADEPTLYTRWFHGAALAAPVVHPSPAAYTAATVGTGPPVEPGWTVLATDAGAPGRLLVRRTDTDRDELRQVDPPWYLPDVGAGLTPGPGDPVRLHPVTTSTSGGFWHAWSAGWRRGGAPARVLRLYLHVVDGAQAPVARTVLATGPPDEVWYVKCATGTHGHERRDVAVLYLPHQDPLPDWVRTVVRETAGSRSDDVPPLTVPLAPGAALAADPGDGTSFGQAVCARLAALAASDPSCVHDAERWRRAAAAAVAPLVEVGP